MASPQAETLVTRIGQIAINAHDVPRAVRFYRDVVGLRFLFQPAENLAFFQCGGTRLMLSTPEKPEYDHPASIIYYQVGDIGTAHQQLTARGARFEDEPHLVAKLPDHDLWMAFCRDSEGNLLALMSEVKPPAGR